MSDRDSQGLTWPAVPSLATGRTRCAPPLKREGRLSPGRGRVDGPLDVGGDQVGVERGGADSGCRHGDDVAIRLTETGDGPVLVCVPGGPGLPGSHLGGLGGLDQSRTLIRPDWRGAGDSDPPATAGHRVVDYVEDLEAIRAFLGLEDFDLLGHSFGGLVAAAYAAAYPARVRRLVVDGPPDWRDKPRILGIELPDHFAVWNDATRSYAAELQGLWYWPAIEWFVRHEWPLVDPTADMARVQAETLVLTGEHDPTFGEDCAALLASYCVRARPAVVRGAGHFTWFEQPDRYSSLVRDFLDEDEALRP